MIAEGGEAGLFARRADARFVQLQAHPRANTDNAGNVPKVGDFVAYNYSGQVATGWITKTGRGRWNPIYTIQQLHPTEGHVSHVRGGSKCVLVLESA